MQGVKCSIQHQETVLLTAVFVFKGGDKNSIFSSKQNSMSAHF